MTCVCPEIHAPHPRFPQRPLPSLAVPASLASALLMCGQRVCRTLFVLQADNVCLA